MAKAVVKVLFVCTGNICRSPTAEGVLRQLAAREGLADRLQVDSAGTTDSQVGLPPDLRARDAAARRGIDLSRLRARTVAPGDFEAFDYLVAMDRSNRRHLLARCPKHLHGKVRLLLEFAAGLPVDEVPDPYGGSPEDFELALDLIDAGSRGLLDHIRERDLRAELG